VKGRLITFEGCDGCGKSTQLGRVAMRLGETGCDVVSTREPGGTALAEAARRIVVDPTFAPDPLTELFLLEAARRDHVRRVIRPALDRGAVVLCDRFVDSSTVYQGIVGGVSLATVERLNRLATDGLEPDRTIVLDLDPETALERRRNRDGEGGSRQDTAPLEFHRRVVEGFRTLAARHPSRVRLVDGRGGPDEVFARVWPLVEEVVG